MSLAVVLGPALADLAERLDRTGAVDPGAAAPGTAASGDAVAVRVRGATESATDRRGALRAILDDGVDTVLVIDTAAPARPDWRRGARLALVADHIGLTGSNPLVGANDDAWGPRFPDLTDAWDPRLRRELRAAAANARLELREGIVAAVTSDQLTAAELAMLRTLGADMASTGFADEAIVARHAGRRVVGIAALATSFSDAMGADELAGLEALLRALLPVLVSAGRAA